VLRDSLRRRLRGGRLSQFTVFALLGGAIPVGDNLRAIADPDARDSCPVQRRLD